LLTFFDFDTVAIVSSTGAPGKSVIFDENFRGEMERTVDQVVEGITTDEEVELLSPLHFLLGTLSAVIVKEILKILKKTKLMHRDYVNNFLLNRIAGFAFDIMIVAGIGAIRVDLIKDYWGVLLILAVVGVFVTFVYIKFVSFKLFKNYEHEQFMVMYGMLTGTASTGVILLREIDPAFETPASENIVYQNFPAILLGFPMMIVAAICPRSDMSTYIMMGILAAYFVVLNIILFRSKIFKKRIPKKAE